ncbi:MAG: LCP family protein [Eubacteriales bacterium]|nr:LCP family protein [Eubacteriales bacterium]
MPLLVLKYVLLAALAGVLVYAGNLAYGMFFDNSYAFQNTGQALATPPPVSSETAAQQPVASGESTPSATIDPYELLLSQADLNFMENRVNILVLGIDESLERSDWGSFRTDTMILVSIDFETNNVYMISLPRDSYVWIYGQNYRARINTAFGAGGGYNGRGFEYAMNTVSLLFGGVPVNHYVCFDITVVKEVVNAIGGLYYDADIEFTMNGRHMDKGYQYMDGQAVLDYCRERHVDSDIGRTARQRAMIMAIFEEMKNTAQIQDIPDIYSAVTGNIYTDLTFEQIVSLAAFAMNIGLEDLHEYYLEGDYLNIDGTSFWGVNQYEKRDMVKEIFGVDISISTDDHVTVLQSLAAEKRAAVAAAEAAAAAAQNYVSANLDYIDGTEIADFNTRKAALLAVAAVKDTKDVGPTIEPIVTATQEFNTWFNTVFKLAIEAKKAEPTPTATVTP